MPDDRPLSWVLHVDLDQFLAAVEIARRPELRGRPVIVGGTGDPSLPRMVVATASYEARQHGVRSGMPLRTAARRCPDAVFLPSDNPAYEAASARVMAALRTLPVVVEEAGWDEAFLAAATNDPEQLAAEVRRTVLDRTGLACSVGFGAIKLQAKTATGFAKPARPAEQANPAKPAGVAGLTDETWAAEMGHRSVGALWGVGPKTVARLAELDVHTVADLAAIDRTKLLERFTPRNSYYLHRMGTGQLDSPVDPTPRVARSRSHEQTFAENLTDRAVIDAELTRLAHHIAEDAAEAGRPVGRVAVKVRVAPFFTSTKIMKLVAPTTDPGELAAAALTVLDRFGPLRPVRLLGVRGEYADR